MREIKFRAWDEKNNTMVRDFKVAPHPEPSLDANEALVRSTWYNLMQFIGLKDKNGKEIYEGDVVFFEGASFRCEFQSGGFVFNFANYEKHTFNFVVEDSEVIGNIYENPKLGDAPPTNNLPQL